MFQKYEFLKKPNKIGEFEGNSPPGTLVSALDLPELLRLNEGVKYVQS